MAHYALVEEWPGGWRAFFRELPGCFAAGSSPEELQSRLRPAVIEHLRWLAQWGLSGPVPGDLEVVVGERLPVVQTAKGMLGPLFQADLTPPTTGELEEALRVANLARAALLNAYNNIPMDRRKTRPAPGERSAVEHMLHVAEVEVAYVQALEQPGEGTQVELPPDPVAAFEVSAAHAEAVLRSLTGEAAAQVYVLDGEQWTGAKALRRMVGHLRKHYEDIVGY